VPIQHALERRSALLAGKIKERTSALAQSFTAAQGRAPYKTKMSQAEAMEWWTKNRYTAQGAQVLANLPEVAVAALDKELTLHAQAQEALGLPTVTEPGTPPPEGGMPVA